MEKIKMLVGQEGPTLSRLPGQELIVGTDVDADEAQRLVDGDLAEEVAAEAKTATPVVPVVSTADAAKPAATSAAAKRKGKAPAAAA